MAPSRVANDRAAPHWDIWVDLADQREQPSYLVVLRSALNPARRGPAGWHVGTRVIERLPDQTFLNLALDRDGIPGNLAGDLRGGRG